MTTSDRLKQIMRERHLKQVDIVRLCEPLCKKYGERLERNDISQYVSGKTVPGQRKLSILGIALNVSEPWLMGYDVSPMRTPTDQTDDGRLKEFIDLFSKLSEEQQTMIIASIKGILSNQ